MKIKISNTDFSPEQLAEYSPRAYIGKGYYKNPELKATTDKVIKYIVNEDPEFYFYEKLFKDPQFLAFKDKAAESLIMENPISALLVYKLHNDPTFSIYFMFWLNLLVDQLVEEGYKSKMGSLLSKEIFILINNIKDKSAKHYDYIREKIFPKLKQIFS